MPTPKNAPYKIRQRAGRSRPLHYIYKTWGGQTGKFYRLPPEDQRRDRSGRRKNRLSWEVRK